MSMTSAARESRRCSPPIDGRPAQVARQSGHIQAAYWNQDSMRSSKSRSRSKSNRPRPLGNIINRVFDSSGPEGKVRGTPQQIIDKYLVLARDAQLSNDRVAAENFLQHAEHYTRMLGEAMNETAREDAARRDTVEVQQQPPQQQHQQPFRPQRDRDGNRPEHVATQEAPAQPAAEPRGDDQRGRGQRRRGGRPVDVIDFDEDGSGSTLVETPEARASVEDPVPPARRAPAPVESPSTGEAAESEAQSEPASGGEDDRKAATRRRTPRSGPPRAAAGGRAAGAPRKSRKTDGAAASDVETSSATGD